MSTRKFEEQSGPPTEEGALQCPDVFDMVANRVRPARELLTLPVNERHALRVASESARQAGAPLYLCPLCRQVVSIRGGLPPDRRVMHFAHPVDPDHRCPYKSGGDLTADEIAAMIYNGAKESRQHQLMKRDIEASLRCDPDVDPSSIRVEQAFVGRLPDASIRRPDVFATWRNNGLVFEAQVSSTSVSVIAARSAFYRSMGSRMLWVFPRWPRDNTDRFTDRDLYYNNNYNVLVVNEATLAASQAAGRFVLEVWWADPASIDREGRAHRWLRERVYLTQLTFDAREIARAWYVDVEGSEFFPRSRPASASEAVAPQSAARPPFQRNADTDNPQEQIRALLAQTSPSAAPSPAILAQLRKDLGWAIEAPTNWYLFINGAHDAGVAPSPYHQGRGVDESLAVFAALECARTGRAEGFVDDPGVLEDLIWTKYPAHYRILRDAATQYRNESLFGFDRPDTPAARRAAQCDVDPRCVPNLGLRRLQRVLYPDLAGIAFSDEELPF